jgi:serine phosphatase RsbU (regulator of sigma subunit)/anti-sigma regulatory factor (Ser/Thr protein kinase)
MQDAPRRLVLASETSCVARASEWLRGLGEEAGLGEDDIYRLDLCAGELLTNIVSHAFEDDDAHQIELNARLRKGEIVLEIVDDGRPFDPLGQPLTASATLHNDRPPGGWGLRLVRRFADQCRYRRVGNRNLTTLRFRHRASAPPLEAGQARRGTERRRNIGPMLAGQKRGDGTIVHQDERTGLDRRILGFISRFEIFRDVPYALVEQAIAGCRIARIPDGEVLLEPGQRNDSVVFVLSGRLRVHLDSPDSPNFFVIDVGDCAGEMSAIDGKPVSAYVVADAGCRVLVMDGPTLFGRLLVIPDVNRKFMAVLFERLRRASDRMVEQARANMELERLQRDLRLAHDIQLGMLPQESQFFPDRADVDCAAGIRVARQVGGDFYDAFFVDQTHLFLMIGDVCGKGLPAALFMVRAMTLLRSEATRREGSRRNPLERMVGRVNQLLIERNDASLFVTLFCALLDTATGKLLYLNAGHCPPVVALPGGEAVALVEPRNPVVGIVDYAQFASGEMDLAPGTALVLYTDGVTEAVSTAEEEFGLERLVATVRASDSGAVALLDATLAAVEDFARAMPQNDDIAVLVARYLGAKQRSATAPS